MAEYAEVWRTEGPELVPLEADRLSVGKSGENEITIDDPRVSRLHAVLERYGSGWSVRDLGSRNGTLVNGARVAAERALRDGDEIIVGRTRIVYRSADPATVTEAAEPAPVTTPRERAVLVELCRPVLGGSMLTEPASVRDIAASLVVTESAVKKHLVNLYDKFRLHDDDRRRGRLAAEAIQRGAVTRKDL